MLSKAMRFATVCTLAFAICGKANRGQANGGKFASFSKGTTEDLEHRFGHEAHIEDHLSTTMNVSSILTRKPTSETASFSAVRKLAAILALSSALTSADALASPSVRTLGVRPFKKDSNTAFAPIHTNNPLHGTPSGPLHASIDAFDQMVHLIQDVPLPQLHGIPSGPLHASSIKEIVDLVGAAVQDVQAAVKDFHAVQGVQAAELPVRDAIKLLPPAVGAPAYDVAGLQAAVPDATVKELEGAVKYLQSIGAPVNYATVQDMVAGIKAASRQAYDGSTTHIRLPVKDALKLRPPGVGTPAIDVSGLQASVQDVAVRAEGAVKYLQSIGASVKTSLTTEIDAEIDTLTRLLSRASAAERTIRPLL